MEKYICKRIGCKKLGVSYSNKYALEKHLLSHQNPNNLILNGKRKRDDLPPPIPRQPDPPFVGMCVCGSHHRDKHNLTRHIEKCPVVVPSTEQLKTFNFRQLRVPSDEQLEALKGAMSVLSSNLKAIICLKAEICIPGFFPILCNTNKGLLSSKFNEFGISGKEGLKVLSEIVEEGPFTIDEAFLITLQDGT